MGPAVIFEHPEQLLDLREALETARDDALQASDVEFQRPPEVKTLEQLEELFKLLKMPEDSMEQVVSVLGFGEIPMVPKARHFLDSGLEFQIKAPDYCETMLAMAFSGENYSGCIAEIPRRTTAVVVRDNPDGTYENEVDTYSGLDNLLHLLGIDTRPPEPPLDD